MRLTSLGQEAEKKDTYGDPNFLVWWILPSDSYKTTHEKPCGLNKNGPSDNKMTSGNCAQVLLARLPLTHVVVVDCLNLRLLW